MITGLIFYTSMLILVFDILFSGSYPFYLMLAASLILNYFLNLNVLARHTYYSLCKFVLSITIFGGFYFVQPNIMSITVALGGALNGLALAVNRGKMPVCPIAMKKVGLPQDFTDNLEDYTVIDKNTKLKILADRYPFGEHVHSIGDIVLYIGGFVFLVHRFFGF